MSSALFQRTHTGKGQLVDVAMLDAALAFLSSFVTDYTVGGHVQGQSGNRAQSRLPTADVFKVQGRPHPARCQQREAVRRAVAGDRPAGPGQGPALRRLAGADRQRRGAARASSRSRSPQTTTRPGRRGSPRPTCRARACGRIAEIVAHPQLAHRDVLQRVDSAYGPMTVIGSGFRLAHGGGSVERPPASPGEHADAILAETGYGEAEIAELRDDGVI